jgi:predicted lipoprotein
MSVAGIVSSGLSQLANIQRNFQQVRGEFKQLGQDLQAGNLTQAQTDFVTLSQSVATQLASNSPTAKALNTLGQARQAGDLSGAKQALASIPIVKVGPCAVPHHSHVPPAQSTFSQSLYQLGQALQSGNLTAAQQAFSAMQQSWQQMSSSSPTATSPSVASPAPSVSGLSITA